MFEEDVFEGTMLEEAKISKNKDSSPKHLNRLRK